MIFNSDYQWPSASCQTKKFDEKAIYNKTKFVYSEIESFFKSIYDHDCFLFPSGRALISQILEYNKIGRNELVFVPKWSSYCVFSSVAYHSNPTIELINKVNVIIANHKWGFVKKVDSSISDFVIEDSVDSIIQSKEFLFPNDGKYEIISLPKIIGSYSGAILFSQDSKFNDYLNKKREENYDLAIRQSRIRNEIMRRANENHSAWNEQEMSNYNLEYNALNDIIEKLKNFNINKKTIISRLEKIANQLSLDIDFNERLGPVLPLPCSKYDINFDKIMVRHFNFNKNEGKGIFEEVFLIPLHFGVSDPIFESILDSIKKK